jgi:hypothetical protein
MKIAVAFALLSLALVQASILTLQVLYPFFPVVFGLFVPTSKLKIPDPDLVAAFQVEPRARECFYEDIDPAKQSQFNMEFEVARGESAFSPPPHFALNQLCLPLLPGGLLDIKLQIMDPFNRMVFEKMAFFNKPDDAANEAGSPLLIPPSFLSHRWLPFPFFFSLPEGKVSIPVSSQGSYSICFDNTMSRWTAKVVR